MSKGPQYGKEEAKEKLIDAMAHLDGRTVGQVADEIGICRNTAYKWLKSEDVKNRIKERSDTLWATRLNAVEEKLLENIQLNDTQAIIYFLNHTKFLEQESKFNIKLDGVEINILPPNTKGERDED